MYVLVSTGARREPSIPWNELQMAMSHHVVLDITPGPLEEQTVFFTAKSSPQPFRLFLKYLSLGIFFSLEAGCILKFELGFKLNFIFDITLSLNMPPKQSFSNINKVTITYKVFLNMQNLNLILITVLEYMVYVEWKHKRF